MTARHRIRPPSAKQAAPSKQRCVAIVEHRLDPIVNGSDVANAAYRAHDQRHPLVRCPCPEFQDSTPSRRRSTSRPLHHEGHGMSLVQKAKSTLAIAGADIGWIEKHPAPRQDTKRLR